MQGSTTKKTFRLPMTGVFVSYQRTKDGKTVAHSLDFDLVAVADDEERAFKKLFRAVKTYVEYGISNGWKSDILFPAPAKCWEAFEQKDVPVQTMEPLYIDDDRMIVVRATIAAVNHACERVAVPA